MKVNENTINNEQTLILAHMCAQWKNLSEVLVLQAAENTWDIVKDPRYFATFE